MILQVRIEARPPSLLARFQPAKAEAVLDDMVKDLAHRLAFRAKNYAPYATGNLRRTIVPHQVRPAEWEVPAVGSENKPYAAFMEFGTRPHWPPSEDIERWVRIKFKIAEPKAVKRTAYLVRRAIAKRGLAPRYYMRQAFEKTIEDAPSVVASYAERLAKAIMGG